MPADSIREQLIAAVCSRLEAIATDSEFHYFNKLRGVERYIHVLNPELDVADDDRDINSGDDLTILVIPETESDDVRDAPSDAVQVRLTLTISFRLGAAATCQEYNRALQDIKRALFRSWDHLGDTVAAEIDSGVNEREIPDLGLPHDTVIYRVTFIYHENFGDPANQE